MKRNKENTTLAKVKPSFAFFMLASLMILTWISIDILGSDTGYGRLRAWAPVGTSLIFAILIYHLSIEYSYNGSQVSKSMRIKLLDYYLINVRIKSIDINNDTSIIHNMIDPKRYSNNGTLIITSGTEILKIDTSTFRIDDLKSELNKKINIKNETRSIKSD